MTKYIVSLLQKTSNDENMTDKKPELSDAMKKKLEPRKFTKNPILGTKFTIAISTPPFALEIAIVKILS